MAKKVKTITYHAGKHASPLHRLPFVGGKSLRGEGISFWNVSLEGNYASGVDLGYAMANAYLTHQRQQSDIPGFLLQQIVLDMAEHYSRTKPKDRAALEGQIVGFFSTLGHFMQVSAQARPDLDLFGEKYIERQANEAIAGRGPNGSLLALAQR